MTGKTKEARVVETLRSLLDKRFSDEMKMAVKVGLATEEENWWYITVEPEQEPPNRYRCYEILAEIENDLRKKHKFNVILIPSMP